MPYVIDMKCSKEDSACVDACPYGCIQENPTALSGQPPYVIDAEQCTDCGACALACPQGAIAPAVAFGRYGIAHGESAVPNLQMRVAPAPTVTEPSAVRVILNEWTDTFVASHA